MATDEYRNAQLGWKPPTNPEGSESIGAAFGYAWRKFPEEKPYAGQICIVAAGLDMAAQVVALRWCQTDEEFYWYDPDLGLDPFPTEVATHWMPWPDDPKA